MHHMISGMKVTENPNLTVPVTTDVEWRWWDEVMAWNPCNEESKKPRHVTTYEPDMHVYQTGGMLIAHPVVVQKMLEALEVEYRQRSPLPESHILGGITV